MVVPWKSPANYKRCIKASMPVDESPLLQISQQRRGDYCEEKLLVSQYHPTFELDKSAGTS